MAATTTPRIKLPGGAPNGDLPGHAGFVDYAGVALDSLRANKLRSFLTLLGIIIGITSIISVISIDSRARSLLEIQGTRTSVRIHRDNPVPDHH